MTTTATGAKTLNSQALVQLPASLLAAAASGSPPVYTGLDGLVLLLSLNNSPTVTITFSGNSLTPAQVVAEVILRFSAAGVTSFTAEAIGTNAWRIRSLATGTFQSINVLASSSPAVLSAFGFAIGHVETGKLYYDQHITHVLPSDFPNPNNNIAELDINPSTVRAFLFLGGSTSGGSALMELLQTSAFLQNGSGTPATVTGTNPVSGFTFGGGGTVDGHTLILTFNGAASPLTVTFAAPANANAVISQINAIISAVVTASLNGSGFLQIVTNGLGPTNTILVGAGTTNGSFGISPGTQTGTAGIQAIDPGTGQGVTSLLQLTGANFGASPTAPQITGSTPITSVTNGLTLTLDDGNEPQTLTFNGATTPTLILTQINALFGAPSGRIIATTNGSTDLVLTGSGLGGAQYVKVVGGTALSALGLTAGTVAYGGPYQPLAGDELWIDGVDYATITQVSPGGNTAQLKINKQVPISANVGTYWYIVANNLSTVSPPAGVTRPYPNLQVDPGTGALTIKQIIIRDNHGVPVTTALAQLYVQYQALRLDVTASATNPALLRFGDTGTLQSNLAPLDTTNPLGLGLYFALLNAPGVQVTGLGVDEISGESPDGTVNGYTRAATFLESFEVYGIAPLTHDPNVAAIWQTHVDFMSEPEQKGERIVLVNNLIPTNRVDTLVASGANGNTTPTSNTFDTGVVNLTALLLAAGLPSAGPYITANGIYLDIGDGNHYNIINVVGSVATIKTSGFQPGENNDGYYATTALPSPLVSETFAVRIRGAALLLPDGMPDKDNIALTVQQLGAGHADRRVWSIVPDQCAATINGIEQIIDGFYLSAAIVGMIGAQPPQQSFTNFPMTGFTRVIHSNDTYSEQQLNVMAAGGNYIVVQDAPGTPLISRMALTTDMTSIETRTDSVVRIVDFVSKFLRTGLKNYIGRFNITQGFIDSLGHVIQGLLGFLTDSGVLIGANLNNIIQDTEEPDTVLVDITLDVPLPCNYIRITLTI